jgi:hypothetical protein
VTSFLTSRYVKVNEDTFAQNVSIASIKTALIVSLLDLHCHVNINKSLNTTHLASWPEIDVVKKSRSKLQLSSLVQTTRTKNYSPPPLRKIQISHSYCAQLSIHFLISLSLLNKFSAHETFLFATSNEYC